MQTWTLVRFLHLAGVAFFVGGQLLLAAAVAPTLRRSSDEQAMPQIARRFGAGSAVALALAIATGAAMASTPGRRRSRVPDHLDRPVDAWKRQRVRLGLDRVARCT